MISLQHVSTSAASLSNLWEYDHVRRTLLIVVDGRPLEVPVCTDSNIAMWHYPIRRLSEDCWRLAPACYVREGGAWLAKHSPYPESEIVEFIDLVNAPKIVARLLEDL